MKEVFGKRISQAQKRGTPTLTLLSSKKIFPKSKRSQMSISFGMIFSIILIVIFISAAFYAINIFLDLSSNVGTGKFFSDFQTDVDKMWAGQQGSQQKEYSLSKDIEYVCFIDYSSGNIGGNSEIYDDLERAYYGDENLFFYPFGSGGDIYGKKINHLDILEITDVENPFCIMNSNGKIRLTIEKDFGESLVTITE